jgi:hypothetical protein
MDVFRLEYKTYEMDVVKKMSLKRLIEKHDYNPQIRHSNKHEREAGYLFDPDYKLKNFYINQGTITSETFDILKNAVKYAKKVMTNDLYEEYEINDLRQLLFLEIQLMIKNNIGIKKCKNCGLYFVSNKKTAYCDRIVEGVDKPCSVVGPKRPFQQRMDDDLALKIYIRAYKTQHARLKKYIKDGDNIKKSDLDAWRREAKKKLKQARTDNAYISEFEKWLNKPFYKTSSK